jgi:hypothetical protein
MYRLIYKSRSILVEVDMETINDIVERSKDLNRRNQISGALLATRTHFLQVIEGEFGPVNQTFFRIATDSRHDNLELVSYGQVEKRLFDGWVMKGFGIFDLNSDLEAVLKKKFGVEEGGVRLPIEEWAALSLMHDIHLITQ